MRRALILALAALVLSVALAACGRGGDTEAATGIEERAADAEILNEVLARQLGVVAAYPRAMIVIDHRTLLLLRKFRAQEGEHADAVVKTLRGMGERAQAQPEEIPGGATLKTRHDRLRFVYAMESATIGLELDAIAKLSSPGARSMLAATVGNQAGHLAVLRRLLGAAPLQVVPNSFETGNSPAP